MNQAPGVSGEAARRLNPRITDTDWLVLTRMQRVIAGLADKLARPGGVALDFGCGQRPYESLFLARGCRYLGADFEEGSEVRIGADGLLPVADRSADLVLSFQVLEHVRDLRTYFSEARRALADDGLMILSTHGTWLYHPHPEDHRRWTRTGLVAEIDNHGFEVLETHAVVGPLAWTTMIRLTCISFALRKAPLVGRPFSALVAWLMNLKALVEESITPKWVTADNACVYVVLCRRKG
jgi:SAM-dependent methyltransferase